MPLTKKGRKIKRELIKEHGKKKGEQIFFSMVNSGKLKGVEEKPKKKKRKKK